MAKLNQPDFALQASAAGAGPAEVPEKSTPNAPAADEAPEERVFCISTVENVHDQSPKIDLYKWEGFAKRVSVPVRTAETVAEYATWHEAKDKRASKAKDVGAFIAGKAEGRAEKAIRSFSMLAFDIDPPKDARVDTRDFMPTLKANKFFQRAKWCAYTTHSSSMEVPRWRWIVPLDKDIEIGKDIDKEGFKSLKKAVASMVGPAFFTDNSQNTLTQLMFWPSVPCDGDFQFEQNDGEGTAFLCVDTLMAEAEAASFDLEDDRPKGHKGELQDPHKAPGWIGAFCRAYTIEEAIETFLPEIYESTDTPGRYTYTKGSSIKGLVCYDGKFAYSHHGTDPAGQMVLNAFDLVRIHRFGNLDGEAKEGTPVNKLHSYGAMQDFCAKDPAANKEMAKATIGDFDTFADEETEWTAALQRDRKGQIIRNNFNLCAIIQNDPDTKAVKYNTMAHRDELPAGAFGNVQDVGECDDRALWRIALLVEQRYCITWPINAGTIADTLTSTQSLRAYNPLQDYFKALEWDGTKRAESLFIDFLGADDTPTTRGFTRYWLRAAVARALNPGCRFEPWLVLAGPQGIGKSTLLKRMAVNQQWFSDSFNVDSTDKEAVESIVGLWLIEVAELRGLSAKEWAALKAFQTTSFDRIREPYARKRKTYPRSCVFACTTNDPYFLKDSDQGNRRWWIVDTNEGAERSVWDEFTPAYRDQVWAEALTWYQEATTTPDYAPRNTDWGYLPKEIEESARRVQMAHAVENGDDTVKSVVIGILSKAVPYGFESWGVERRQSYLAGNDFAGFGEEPNSAEVFHRRKITTCALWEELPKMHQRQVTPRTLGKSVALITGVEQSKVKRQRGWKITDEFFKAYGINPLPEGFEAEEDI